MTLADVRSLFAYNTWANDHVFASLDPLTDEEWTREVGGSFPSLRATAAHLIATEWIWLRRWQGRSPRALEPWMTAASRTVLAEKRREIEAERAVFFDALDEQALLRDAPFELMNGVTGSQPLGRLLLHLVNHQSYHRGQIATQLRQVGRVPVSTDLLLFDMGPDWAP